MKSESKCLQKGKTRFRIERLHEYAEEGARKQELGVSRCRFDRSSKKTTRLGGRAELLRDTLRGKRGKKKTPPNCKTWIVWADGCMAASN